MSESSAQITIERLSDLDGWEFYHLVDTADERAMITIGIRPYPEAKEIEYGIWRLDKDTEDPEVTGSVAYEHGDRGWTDGTREEIVQRIVNAHSSDLEIGGRELVFRLDGEGNPTIMNR